MTGAPRSTTLSRSSMTSREVMVLPSRQCHFGSTSARSIRHASFEFLPCALNHFSMYSCAMNRTLDRSPGSGRGTRSFGVAASRVSKSEGSGGSCPGANGSLFAGEVVRSSLFLLPRRSTARRGSIPLSSHSRFFIASWRASARPREGNLPSVIRVGVPSHLRSWLYHSRKRSNLACCCRKFLDAGFVVWAVDTFVDTFVRLSMICVRILDAEAGRSSEYHGRGSRRTSRLNYMW